MGKRKHPKLRACGRWGVWVCTGLMVVGFVSSFVIQPGVIIEHLDFSTRKVAIFDSIDLHNGQLVVKHHRPVYPQPLSDSLIVYGIDLRFRTNQYSSWSISWWNVRPYRSTDPSFATLWSFSIVYPTLFVLGWSLWLVRGRRKLRRRVGCCSECGYSLDGLTSDVCPECGEKHGA